LIVRVISKSAVLKFTERAGAPDELVPHHQASGLGLFGRSEERLHGSDYRLIARVNNRTKRVFIPSSPMSKPLPTVAIL
jgi:mRNA-degrading endonuclease RelE of RelBE toxin-antitoxin system